jgi:hypothetical protein
MFLHLIVSVSKLVLPFLDQITWAARAWAWVWDKTSPQQQHFCIGF